MRLKNLTESANSIYIISAATVLQYILLLWYLRAIEMFAQSILMIEAIIWDLRYYIITIAFILFGFSQALYLNAYQYNESDDGVGFGNPGGALAQAFVLFVGNPAFPPSYGGSDQTDYFSNNSFATFLQILLVFLGSILMLNLLITIMGNTFDRLKKQMKTEWLRQLCVTIAKQNYLCPPKPDKFIHFLKRREDVENDYYEREEKLRRQKKRKNAYNNYELIQNVLKEVKDVKEKLRL